MAIQMKEIFERDPDLILMKDEISFRILKAGKITTLIQAINYPEFTYYILSDSIGVEYKYVSTSEETQKWKTKLLFKKH